MSDDKGQVRALRADHESVEGAHAFLAELLATGKVKGVIIAFAENDGVGWARFGEVLPQELALAGAAITYRAVTTAIGE